MQREKVEINKGSVAQGVTAVVDAVGRANKEEKITCPICGDVVVNATVATVCSIRPDELDTKHCFFGVEPLKMAIFEHAPDGQHEESVDEEESVSIDIE